MTKNLTTNNEPKKCQVEFIPNNNNNFDNNNNNNIKDIT